MRLARRTSFIGWIKQFGLNFELMDERTDFIGRVIRRKILSDLKEEGKCRLLVMEIAKMVETMADVVKIEMEILEGMFE